MLHDIDNRYKGILVKVDVIIAHLLQRRSPMWCTFDFREVGYQNKGEDYIILTFLRDGECNLLPEETMAKYILLKKP